MPFRPPKKNPQFADLKGILAQTKDIENPLYQTVQILIDRLSQNQSVNAEQVAAITGRLPGSTAKPVITVVREIPAGAINGINATFTLANVPILDSEQVYWNGLLQDTRGMDYNLTGAVITFLIPPQPGDRILVTYQRT